jgi:hypothetical protein
MENAALLGMYRFNLTSEEIDVVHECMLGSSSASDEVKKTWTYTCIRLRGVVFH